MVYRAGGCQYCGGEQFHHLGCPFVRWTLTFTTIGFAVMLGAFLAVNGREGGAIGLGMLFLLYLTLLLGWLLASRRRRNRR